MNSRKIDFAWRILVVATVEVANPLLLISLALFCGIGYILSLLAPINIDVWAATLVGSVLLPLMGLSLRARRVWERSRREIPPFSWRALLPLLSLVALLPSAFFILAYPSLRSISHTDIYFVYVGRILNAATPPENIFLPGLAANQYWLLHALIASLLKLTGLDVYFTYNAVNCVFVFSGVYWLAQTLIALKLAKSRTVFLVSGIIFLLGSLNLGGILNVIEAAASEPDARIYRGLMLMEGADRRLHSTVYKLFHASSFTPAFAAFAALLFCSVRLLRQRPDLLLLTVATSSVLATLAVMPIIAPFTLGVLAALSPIALFYLFGPYEARKRFVVSARSTIADFRPWRLLAWLLVSLGLLVPLCGYVLDLMQSSSGILELTVASQGNTGMTVAAHYLLLPFALLHLLYAIRRPRRESVYLQIVSLVGLALVLGIELPDNNQYKIHYALAVLMALSFLTLLDLWLQSQSAVRRRIARLLLCVMVTLGLLNVAYAQLALINRVITEYGTARYRGATAELLDSDYGRRLSAHYWIRDNTSHDALVLAPLAYAHYSSLLSGRLTYVRQTPGVHLASRTIYGARKHKLSQFFDPDISVETYRGLVKSIESELPGRPIYAIVYDADLSPEVMARRGATLVFKDTVDAAKVYLLNLTNDA